MAGPELTASPAVTPEILLRAYAMGLFPMAESRDATDLHWIDPRRRGIFPLEGFHISRSLRRAIRPEFLNRLDEILLFNRLSRAHMTDIVEVQMQKLLKLLADRKIELKLDGKAMQWLANRGYDPVYGARPLKRVIQRSLQNPLATQLLEGRIHDGDTVEVGVENGELTVGGERVMSDAAD